MAARTWFLAVALALALVVNVGCGSSARTTTHEASAAGEPAVPGPVSDPETESETPDADRSRRVVDADRAVIIGDLTPDELEMLDWGRERFALAGLQLPAEISVRFDPSRKSCGGNAGRCDPSDAEQQVTVCERDGDSMYRIVQRRLALLHELAHLWHWAQGDETCDWPDLSAIVGGSADDPEAEWADRAEERVAMAIAWGLMDQLRRPVGSPLTCAELYRQIEQLTGHEPLGPIERFCVPIVSGSVAAP